VAPSPILEVAQRGAALYGPDLMVTQPAYLKNLKAYARAQWPGRPNETIDVTRAYQHESDRGAIILAATHLEDNLMIAILAGLPTLQRDEVAFRDMFENDGPLSTFSSRIAMAYGMGLATAQMKKEMDLIRVIRNSCAHSRKPISLDTPELRIAVLRLLSDTVDFLKDTDVQTLKMAFTLRCYMLAESILKAEVFSARDQILAMVTATRSP
jgi:hypothetical protein